MSVSTGLEQSLSAVEMRKVPGGITITGAVGVLVKLRASIAAWSGPVMSSFEASALGQGEPGIEPALRG